MIRVNSWVRVVRVTEPLLGALIQAGTILYAAGRSVRRGYICCTGWNVDRPYGYILPEVDLENIE